MAEAAGDGAVRDRGDLQQRWAELACVGEGGPAYEGGFRYVAAESCEADFADPGSGSGGDDSGEIDTATGMHPGR